MLNGIQTQSALTHQVLEQMAELEALGVDVLRISPQYTGSMRIIEIFDAARKGLNQNPWWKNYSSCYRWARVTVIC